MKPPRRRPALESDETVAGQPYAALGNAVSKAITDAVAHGMGTDVAACIAAQVAADYARMEYGDRFLDKLAQVVRDRGNDPLPCEAT